MIADILAFLGEIKAATLDELVARFPDLEPATVLHAVEELLDMGRLRVVPSSEPTRRYQVAP